VPGQPTTTLHLPTTLRLVDQLTGEAKFGGSYSLYTSVLAKRGTPKQLIGAGTRTCAPAASGGAILDCNSAFALKSGVLLISDLLDLSKGTISGKIIGGSGTLAGARGSISGVAKPGAKFYLTVSYYIS
jgi:hypothetical protein